MIFSLLGQQGERRVVLAPGHRRFLVAIYHAPVGVMKSKRKKT